MKSSKGGIRSRPYTSSLHLNEVVLRNMLFPEALAGVELQFANDFLQILQIIYKGQTPGLHTFSSVSPGSPLVILHHMNAQI